MSARKSSHGTIFLIVSSGSPLALIASSLRSISKKPVCPMTRSLHPPMAHCNQRVRFAATWREEFFEVPICKSRLAERDLTQHWVYPGHFAQQHAHVGLRTEHFAQGCRNFCRRQPCRRHLIEQRLEKMIVALIEQGDPAGYVSQSASRGEAAKAAAEDNHVWQAGH